MTENKGSPLMSAEGPPSVFVGKRLLLRGGYVRELVPASYPHIHRGGGDFPCIEGGGRGGVGGPRCLLPGAVPDSPIKRTPGPEHLQSKTPPERGKRNT